MLINNLKMGEKLLIVAACIGGSFVVALSANLLHIGSLNVSKDRSNLLEEQSSKLSRKQLYRTARSITVKVFSGDTWGSGILIRRKEYSYIVLSSAHLINSATTYKVQTSDGHIFSARLLRSYHTSNHDIGFLEFHSEQFNYEVASLSNSTVTPGDPVIAAGYSFEAESNNSDGFVITQGKISWLLDQALINGYQIGYTNDVGQGMSGGPLLNVYGQVIGMNGMDKYPLWGTPYVFKDGSVPSKEFQEKMRYYSWAIPINTSSKFLPE